MLCQQLVESKDFPSDSWCLIPGPRGAKPFSRGDLLKNSYCKKCRWRQNAREKHEKASKDAHAHDFYEGGRHEMLNELNHGEVRTNLLVWLSKVLRDPSHESEALWARQHQHH
jgi:hypothetical protein